VVGTAVVGADVVGAGVAVVVGGTVVVGHASVPQLRVRIFSAAGGHALTPFAAGVCTERVDCCSPVAPQVVTLHMPKSDQLPIKQSCTRGAVVGGGVFGGRVGGQDGLVQAC